MLSIIIPTYNSGRFITPLLDSILKSASDLILEKNLEIIIVDDCSTDNTVGVASVYHVRIIKLKVNSGPARARNTGAKEAKGDILFFLDSDVILTKDMIKEVKDYFDNNPASNCVIGICDKEPLNDGFVPRYMALFEYAHLAGSNAQNVSVFSPRCGAVRKEFFKKLGGFNESYGGADIEDFEFARRVNKTDKIFLNRKMIVKHKFATFSEAVRNYFKRASMWVRLFMKEKSFDNAGPSVPSNAIAAISAFLSFVSLFFILFSNKALYFFIFFVAIYLTANLRWLNFMQKEAGLSFSLKALFLNYIFCLDIMVAAIFGLITYPFMKRAKGARSIT